jgi:hypothetical protein
MPLCDLADDLVGIHHTARASCSKISRWIIANLCRSTVLNVVPASASANVCLRSSSVARFAPNE